MIRLLYSLIFYVATPLVLLRLVLRSLRAPAYRKRLPERFGYPALSPDFDPVKPTLWIHAVSVGETVAAAPLVEQLKQTWPGFQIFITTMTPTGSDRVTRLFGDTVFHSYLPYDLPGAVNRLVRHVNPVMLILMETELWPNLIHSCAQHKVKLVLANARLSEKSAAGYRRFVSMTAGMLASFDLIAAQGEQDAERLVGLGADPDKVKVTGSLKFHVDIGNGDLPDEPVFASIKASGRTVIVAASTREGEESLLLPVIQKLSEANPGLLFILVPRHPERFDQVAELSRSVGLKLQRRSSGEAVDPGTQLLLGDSMGEMGAYYQVANIAFVGGSLVDTGCQNVLEPAALALPVVVGPSQYNFAVICAQLEQAGGLHTVSGPAELADFLQVLVMDPQRQQLMGQAARSVVAANQQALPRLLALLEPLLSG